MPTYCYKCPECENEKRVRLDYDHDPPLCDDGHEETEMNRDYNKENIAGIHFKGEGFHSTDYD